LKIVTKGTIRREIKAETKNASPFTPMVKPTVNRPVAKVGAIVCARAAKLHAIPSVPPCASFGALNDIKVLNEASKIPSPKDITVETATNINKLFVKPRIMKLKRNSTIPN